MTYPILNSGYERRDESRLDENDQDAGTAELLKSSDLESLQEAETGSVLRTMALADGRGYYEEETSKQLLSSPKSNTSTIAKRRMKAQQSRTVELVTTCDTPEDGHKWKKYGTKRIVKSPFPRFYYRCAHRCCPMKKQVWRNPEKPDSVKVVYFGHGHTHSRLEEQQGSLFSKKLSVLDIAFLQSLAAGRGTTDSLSNAVTQGSSIAQQLAALSNLSYSSQLLSPMSQSGDSFTANARSQPGAASWQLPAEGAEGGSSFEESGVSPHIREMLLEMDASALLKRVIAQPPTVSPPASHHSASSSLSHAGLKTTGLSMGWSPTFDSNFQAASSLGSMSSTLPQNGAKNADVSLTDLYTALQSKSQQHQQLSLMHAQPGLHQSPEVLGGKEVVKPGDAHSQQASAQILNLLQKLSRQGSTKSASPRDGLVIPQLAHLGLDSLGSAGSTLSSSYSSPQMMPLPNQNVYGDSRGGAFAQLSDAGLGRQQALGATLQSLQKDNFLRLVEQQQEHGLLQMNPSSEALRQTALATFDSLLSRQGSQTRGPLSPGALSSINPAWKQQDDSLISFFNTAAGLPKHTQATNPRHAFGHGGSGANLTHQQRGAGGSFSEGLISFQGRPSAHQQLLDSAPAFTRSHSQPLADLASLSRGSSERLTLFPQASHSLSDSLLDTSVGEGKPYPMRFGVEGHSGPYQSRKGSLHESSTPPALWESWKSSKLEGL